MRVYTKEYSTLFHRGMDKLFSACLILSILLLSGCGGGGGGSDNGGEVIVGTGSFIEGTAAVGAPLADKEVIVKARQGMRAETRTASSGRFSTPKLDAEGPYLTRVERTSGQYLYSIAFRDPAGSAEQTLKANVHPFTDLIIRNWLALQNVSIEGVFENDEAIPSLPTQAQIDGIEAEIRAIISQALTANGAPAGFKLFTSDFDADNLGFDLFLDNSQVVILNQTVNVSITDADTSIENIIVGSLPLNSDLTSPVDNAPSVPGNPRALVAEAGASEGDVVLYWDPSTDDKGVSGYNIYRNGSTEPIATTPFPVYTDSGLAVGQDYSYQIEAIDGRGQLSSKASTSVTLDAPDTTAPPTATNLNIEDVLGTLSLSWTQTDIADVAGFRIIRNNSPGSYATVTATSFVDFDVDTGSNYCYKIITFDAAGNESSPSTEVCELVDDQDDTPNSNIAPDSNAGSDQTVLLGATILLDGSGSSDPDNGDTLSYQWSVFSQPAGANTSFNNSSAVSPELSVDTAGTYIIQLEASDGELTDVDIVTIVVSNPPSNAAPVSDAGEDQSVNLGAQIQLDGSGSSDPDGDSLSYQWSILSQPNGATASFDNSASNTPVLTANTIGSYEIQLEVSDGSLTANDTLTVTISSLPPANTPPVINSFALTSIPAFVNASATFSWDISDVDGDQLTCLLDIDNDGTNDYGISDCTNTGSQQHTYTAAGDYTAKLTIEDGENNVVFETLSLSVLLPLALDVSVNGPAIADKRLLYTINVGNTTQADIENVIVSLVLPNELSFIWTNNAEPNVSSGCTGCIAGQKANWNIGTLAAGDTSTISVDTLISASALTGTDILLPVSVNANSMNEITVTKSTEVNNSPSADLAIGASADPVTLNQTFTYQLDLGNTSGSALDNTELRVFLPAGVTVDSVSDGGTEVNSGEVLWDEGSLSVGSSLRRSITVTADNVSAGQILKASAQLSFDGGQAIDNSAEHALTVRDEVSPLQLDISTSANPVVSDERFIYSLTVSNTSLLPVNNVNLQLRLPEELSFNWVTNAEPGASSGCTNCISTSEANWSLGTFAAGESRTITVNPLVASALSGTLISLPVRVTATDLKDTIYRLHTVGIYNTSSADLAVSASTDPIVANETFTYLLDVGNTSAGTLSNAQLKVLLPEGVTVVSISNGGSESSSGEVVWNEGNLAVGTLLHREITVTADNVSAGETLKATAQLTFDGGQAIDNTAEHALTVRDDASPLQVDISTSANPVVSDERFIYTLTVSNTSLLPVNDVSLQLRIPEELSFNWSTNAEPRVSSGCTNCISASEANWSLGTLAAGESRTITVNPLVASALSGTLISLPVRVTATDLEDTIDRLHTVGIHNTSSADLAVSASTDPIAANETFTYLLDVGNTSAGTLSNTQLRVLLPEGITVVSISDGGTETSSGEVLWNEGSLAVGTLVHREITVTADNVSAGEILKAIAQLTFDGGQAIDNTAEHALTVRDEVSPLQVDISTSANPVVSGERFIYTLTVSNTSLLPVNDVSLQLRLPEELSFNWTTNAEPGVSSGCTNCISTSEANWSLGTLAAGESRTITVNPLVASALSGNLIALPVRVSATDLEDTIDRLHIVGIYNTPSAELAVSASVDPVTPNETFTYYVDVSNPSGSSLSSVTLRAFLPPGVSVSTISDSGTEVSTGEVVWNISSLGSGSHLRREVEVTADSAIAGDSLKLLAELTHSGGIENDMRSEFVVSVAENSGSASQLSVDIATTPSPVASSSTLTYTVTLTNNFGLPLDSVNVQLRVPDEFTFNWTTESNPTVSSGCTNCISALEANWALGTIAAGASRVITIDANVASGLTDGTLIVAPFRVTADDMEDTINLQQVTVIEN